MKRIGAGGNGDVWKASKPGEIAAAIKILRTPDDRERMGRFRQEVEFLLSNPGRVGVLGIVDSDLTPATGKPWYAMPLAVPLLDALGPDPSVESVIAAFARFADTLAGLHEEGIGHRDLKPDNLFHLDGEWVVGDFGLVRRPETALLTKARRRLGPIDFMAPEMRADADTADAGPADVYSLAKSLWVVLTGSALPLPGPHRPDDLAYSLTARIEHAWTTPLDSLLRRATTHEPGHRPTMEDFRDELEALFMTEDASRLQAADLNDIAATIRRYAEPEQDRVRLTAQIENRLNHSSGPPHDAMHAGFTQLEDLLLGWRHNRRSDQSAAAYRLLEPSHWPHRGERGREDEFSLRHPADEAKTIVIKISVAVRLKADAETLAIAGGISFQDYVAMEPEWLTSVVREVPLSSSLELGVHRQLSVAYEAGIDAALRRATEALQ